MITHGSLFSGIGGFDLAACWAGIETRWQVEIDNFCNKVLEKHFPNAKRYKDIKEVKGLERVDIISGGFPCQPFSIAGKQKGKDDDRYLWEEMLRIIREVKPSYVIGENVANLWNMGFENLLVDLENEGYEVESFIIPACATGAPHKRNRIWIIAYSKGIRKRGRFGKIPKENEKISEWNKDPKFGNTNKDASYTDRAGWNEEWAEQNNDKKGAVYKGYRNHRTLSEPQINIRDVTDTNSKRFKAIELPAFEKGKERSNKFCNWQAS